MKDYISIIVPIENSEKYLARCLNSILNQTYEKYELICVLNGSTDKSEQILSDFAKSDTRIKIYNSPRGVSEARNKGLSVAEGDWFCFIDSDDWVENNYLEILLENAIAKDADISACMHSRDKEFLIFSDKEFSKTNQNIEILDSSEACIHNFICHGNSMNGMTWNKLYKMEKFGQVRFDNSLKVNEDCLYTMEIMKACNRACLTNLSLYHWFVNANGASSSKRKTIDFSPANVFLRMLEDCKELDDLEVDLCLIENYFKNVVSMFFDVKKIDKTDEVKSAIDFCRDNRKKIWKRINWKYKVKYVSVIWSNQLVWKSK